jgi:hypothetical protein
MKVVGGEDERGEKRRIMKDSPPYLHRKLTNSPAW